METLTQTPLKGGEFLVKESDAASVFISEEFSEETRMIQQSCREFVETEVLSNIEEIDSHKNWGLPQQLLEKAADLGFLGLGVPEEYGGFEVPFATTLLLSEEVAKAQSFSLTIGVQTSIGIAPVLFYANAEQRAKYLPKMVTAELKTCYCLTEPDSGSDANAAKTKAIPTEDGKHYILNGQKMWITNAGFADMFIVFAKIEEDKNLSAFIVEKAFGGVSLGDEEQKMGIKGSSTRQVFFNDVKVPAENLLGERGNGFKMALNVLNTGRIKLGASAIGSSKQAIDHAIEYAKERKQFGTSIANFGAIKHKLGEMAARIYSLEASLYRTAHHIDLKKEELVAGGMDETQAKYKSVEEYAIECAIAKVVGSETQDFCVDEGLQIFGGMGFSEDAPMARLYRNSRINRIFEGTNEINRMLTVDMILKRALKGEIDLMTPAKAVASELTSIPDFGSGNDDALLGEEKKVLRNLKKVIFMIAGAAVQKFMQTLDQEQELLMNLADMLMQVYTLESGLLKTEKMIAQNGEVAASLQLDMLRIFMHSAANIVNNAGKEALYSFAEGDELRMMLMGLKRFTKLEPFNMKAARRRIADKLIAEGKYCF